MIRKSSTGKSYISGKRGVNKLDDIPEKIIYKGSRKTRKSSSVDETKEEVKGKIFNDIDIIDIFDFIAQCNGVIVKLPNEKYVENTESSVKTDSRFKPLGIGEIAAPVPEYNPTKLNVNANFKKVGAVDVELNGSKMSITSFTFNKKSIFYAGENYIKNIGVVVPSEKEDEFLKTLGKSLAVSKIADKKVTQPLSTVIGSNSGIKFYKIKTDNIGVLSPEKMKKSLLTSKDIYEIQKQLYEYKVLGKYFSPKCSVIKDIKEKLTKDELEEVYDRKLFGMFNMMSKDGIEVCKNAGIDVYSGAFIATEKLTDVPKEKKDSHVKNAVTIEYIAHDYNYSKVTGKNVHEKYTAGKIDDLRLSKEAVDKIKHFNEALNHEDFKEALRYANINLKECEKEVNRLNKILWMHNTSMFILGEGMLHTFDRADWTVNTKSRAKAESFVNTKYPLEIRFTGASM